MTFLLLDSAKTALVVPLVPVELGASNLRAAAALQRVSPAVVALLARLRQIHPVAGGVGRQQKPGNDDDSHVGVIVAPLVLGVREPHSPPYLLPVPDTALLLVRQAPKDAGGEVGDAALGRPRVQVRRRQKVRGLAALWHLASAPVRVDWLHHRERKGLVERAHGAAQRASRQNGRAAGVNGVELGAEARLPVLPAAPRPADVQMRQRGHGAVEVARVQAFAELVVSRPPACAVEFLISWGKDRRGRRYEVVGRTGGLAVHTRNVLLPV